MKAQCKLLVFYLSCIIICTASAPYEGFLSAFPHANISDLLSLEQPFNAKSYPFTSPTYSCPVLQHAPDTNDVSNLKPGNIKVVMAMGDSITAGSSIFDSWIIDLNEYRGSAFSMGSDNGVFSIPNFFLKSGCSITGASTGGSRDHPGNGFNAAVSGAKNQDLLSQAQWLVAKLQSSPNINFNLDWKLLTIWIGSNNLCDVCHDEVPNDSANYENNLIAALQHIFNTVPRVFVNLVAPLDVATLWNIEGAVCSTIHAIACPCAGSPFSSDRAKASQVAKEYVARSYTVANFFNKKKSDFAVVVQPFLQETIINDRKLLSEADCFHPSAQGHAAAATALWNNMLSPAVQKKKSWNSADLPRCPTNEDKLYID